MNDDESHIQSIVRDSKDRVLRSKYATWLEEKNDPRAAYIRAELRWATEKDRVEQQTVAELADSHDTVWIARVSRPPIGICSDILEFTHDVIDLNEYSDDYSEEEDFETDYEPEPRLKEPPRITSDELDNLESLLEIKLPCQYRAFMQNYNGGRPSSNRFKIPGYEYVDDNGTDFVQTFDVIWEIPNTPEHFFDHEDDLVKNLNWKKNTWGSSLNKGIFKDVISIGSAGPGQWICIGTSGKLISEVFAVVPDEDGKDFHKVASSLGAFLEMLECTVSE